MKSFIKKAICIAAGIAALAPSIASAQSSASPYTSATRYDALGRVVGTIAPDPDNTGTVEHLATRTTYDQRGNVTKVETGVLSSWKNEDTLPQNWGSQFNIHTTAESTYDAANRKLVDRVKGSDGVTISLTQYSYDSVGRLECTAVRMNPEVYATIQTYDACVPGPAGTDQDNYGPDRITKTVYDAAGQVVQIRKAVGTSIETADVTYKYTSNGQIEQVIDSNGNRAEMRYDAYDRQTEWVFPAKARPANFNNATQATALATAGALSTDDGITSTDDKEIYAYDENGNRTQLTKRDGSVMTYQYDALNRMIRKTVPERQDLANIHTRDVFYDYDLRGLPLHTRFNSLNGRGQRNIYDGFGRVTQIEDNTIGTMRAMSYQYDTNGNRTRLTHHDNYSWNFEHDQLNRVTHIKQGTYLLGTSVYNDRGLMDRLDWPSDALSNNRRDYDYDTAGRLDQIAINLHNTAKDVTWDYTRNPASQIRSEAQSNDVYSWDGQLNIDRTYTTNGLNQYENAGPASFTYDKNGNLTSDGTTTYRYDIENRLVRAWSGGNVTELFYDPLGRLYKISDSQVGTTHFLYDGNALAVEIGASGQVLRRYVHGSNAEADDPLVWYEGAQGSGTGRRFVHSDPRGSIVAVTDYQGASIATNSYDEYGIPDTAAGDDIATKGRFRYTGQAWIPELGMYYYKARIYSPTLGRFLQTDPIGYEDQYNLYAYVGNDPINGTDPTGLAEVNNASENTKPSGNLCSRLGSNACPGNYAGSLGRGTDGGSQGTETANQSRARPAPNGAKGKSGQGINWGEVWASIHPTVRSALTIEGILEAALPEEKVMIFRVWGGRSKMKGRFWSPTPPQVYGSEREMRQALAIAPRWNAAKFVTSAWVPQSNIAVRRIAAPQTVDGRTYSGGAFEYILRDPARVQIIATQRLRF